MTPRIITATAWACALAVIFYRRALVPLALLALDALTSSQAPPAAPAPALGEGLTNAEIKAILGIKGNRARAQLLERLRNSTWSLPTQQTPPTYPCPPCTTPATPKTSKSSTAGSWTSSARAKTPIAATTSPASSARSKL